MDAPGGNPPPLKTLGGGRYRVEDRLGTGGMASVWLAHDERLGVWRAAKILHRELAVRAKLRERFENEARTLALLEHQNIVRVYDVGSDESVPWLVMELLQGGSPEDWVQRGKPLPPRLAADVVLAACAGLAVAHDRGVVHRDVKPSNILFGADGTPKVTDFGIARAQDARRGLTRAGTAMGTLAFMAPEQHADAASVDLRADVFALGVTLFNLATAKLSHKLPLAEEDPRILRELHPALHPVVIRACRAAREDRYPDIRAFAADLKAAVPRLPLVPPDFPPLHRSDGTARDPSAEELTAPTESDAATMPPLTRPPDLREPPLLPRSIAPPTHSPVPPATPPRSPSRASAPPSAVPSAAPKSAIPVSGPRSATPQSAPRSATPAPAPRAPTPAPGPRSATPAPVPRTSATPAPPPAIRSSAPAASPGGAAARATPRPAQPAGTPPGVPASARTLTVEIPRKLRLTLELPCEARHRIAEGPGEATPAIHRVLRDSPACSAAAAVARKGGTAAESIHVRLGSADPVPWTALKARIERVERHAHLCYACPARVEDRDWGCVVELPLPIPAVVEERLVDRVQPGSTLGGRMIAEALDGDRIKGSAGARLRAEGVLQLEVAATKLHSRGLFLSRYVTGDELAEALFAPARGANYEIHCLGLLIGLGGLIFDGVGPERLGAAHLAELLALPTPDQRRDATKLAVTAEDPPMVVAILALLRAAWVLGAPITAAL